MRWSQQGRILSVVGAVVFAACGGNGSSSSSDAGSVGSNTDAGGVGQNPDAGASTLVAFGSSATTVNLVWSPASGAAGYTLERRSGSGAYAQIQSLDATATTFLDRNLTPQTAYTYRLTASNATQDAVREYSAATSDASPLQTQGEVPVGAPVQQTIGSGGGTVASVDQKIQLVIPAGALPDGTGVTLQTIQNPLADEDAPALSILSDVPFTKAVDLRFQLGDDLPETAAVALQDADGLWLTAPVTFDATTGMLTVTLPAQAQSAAPRRAASGPARRRALRFKRFYVYPRVATVRTGSRSTFEARALLSTDRCVESVDPDACAWVVELIRIKEQGVAGAVKQVLTEPLPDYATKSVPNSEGVWSLAPSGPSSGTLFVPALGADVTYTAPAAIPATKPILIRFVPNARPGAESLHSDPGKIYFLGNKYEVKGDFFAASYGLDEAINAHVTDSFSVVIELVANAGGGLVVNTSELHNGQSTYDHPVCPDPTVISFDLGCCFEVITADSATATYARKTLTLQLEGVEALAPATLHYPGGFNIPYPGGSNSTTVTIDAPVDLESLSKPTGVETNTGWTLTITPLALF